MNLPAGIELSCSSSNYGAYPFQRALEGISRAGFKQVGVGGTHEKQRYPSYQLGDEKVHETHRLIQSHGLSVNACLCFEIEIGADGSTDQFRRELDVLAMLGCRRAIIGGPWRYAKFPNDKKAPEVWRRECDAFYKSMDQILPHAEKLNIVICIKPHAGLAAHSREVAAVLDRLKSPSFRICWDAGNVSFYEGICPDPGLAEIVPAIRCICLKDHLGPRANAVFPPLGEGNVRHDEYLNILSKGGFSDVIMIEKLGVRAGEAALTAEQIDQRAIQAREFVLPLLAKHFRST